ncbi:transcriptional protein SWT1-like isoform X2 [Patiria miniata]|uniref:WW domain-containing protein n=1 Tax=Patiria miniata TaxID=46514 RepID=A0A913Z1F8_PATMI|nr:transcriptional protein SWT1-like isoform X2 [Patiria miniata]
MSKNSDQAMSSSSNNSFFNLMGFIKKKPPLPEGWIVKQSSTYPDRIYFFNVRTGATTWTAPGAMSSDTGSTISDTSDKPLRSKTRAAHPATSQTPSGVPASSNTRRLPTPTHPGNKPQPSRVTSPPAKGRSESLGKHASKIKSPSPVALKREDWLKVQHFKLTNMSRIQKATKRRLQEEKVRMVTPSPPWGIPLKGSHPAGTLTPESLTPKSLTSPNGRDASSVSSRSSKLGSPAKSKPLRGSPTNSKPQQVRKKRSFESDSSDSHALDSRAKSKHLKATIGQKPLSDSRSEATPRLPTTRNSSNNSGKTVVKQPQGTTPADKRDLRIHMERSKQLKTVPQQPQREKQASRNQAAKLPSAPTSAPKLPPTANHTGKPGSESSASVASRDSQPSSKPKKTSRASWRRKEFKASAKEINCKGSNISFVKNYVSTVAANTNSAGNSSSCGVFNKGPGVSSFPAAEEDDELCQMEIDFPDDTVDTGGNSDNKNLGLRVVLDTNVLMHDLKFVKDLLDKRIQGLGLPTLVIPWVVMQELDSLKIGSTKGGAAWNAVQFLHKCVMNEHPRVKGEPMRKSSEEADFEITCNDDWILQCCLQQQKIVGKDLVVLLTNDKHLCSKAVISSIKAFSKETLLSGLEALSDILQHRPPLPPVPTDSPAPETHRPRTPIESPLTANAEKELCDELICQVKETLLQGLTVVLEKEMKDAYEDLWTEIVIIKPPWSFNDVMQCYEKHWIAVFGFFLNREDRRHFQQIVELTSILNVSLDSVKRLINSSVYFCRRLHNQKRYGTALEQPILRLGDFKKRCLAPSPEGKQSPNQALPSEDLALKLSGATEIVPIVFEAVWLKICQLSALIFEGLGIPHDLETDKTSVIPSALECHACLDILCPLLQQIIKALERVTEIPDSCIGETPLPFERLCQTMQIFLREFISHDRERYASLTTLALQKFVMVYSNRQLLRNGIVQLANALTRLAQCHGVSS